MANVSNYILPFSALVLMLNPILIRIKQKTKKIEIPFLVPRKIKLGMYSVRIALAFN